jgi:molecular chaperone Hsp33
MVSRVKAKAPPSYIPAPKSDFVLPFDLPDVNLRGRFVRLGAVSSRALEAHPLPEAAARILAEAVSLDALLGTSLKLDGRVSVQLKGDGPLGLAVADFYAGGGVRGYARFDAQALKQKEARDFASLVGKGILAITLEPRPGATNYQGMVELSDKGLSASAETYFAQSEQLPTLLRLAAAPLYRAGDHGKHGWAAGGLMVQAVPGASEREVRDSDDWARISLFLQTLEDYELLDTEIAAEDVLWRLFHEDELRVQPFQPLHFQCSCSAEKVRPVLETYPAEERKSLAEADGIIRARCEFCGASY